jgi:hypothetical protein
MNPRQTPQHHQPHQPTAHRRPVRGIIVATAAGTVIGILGLTRFLTPHPPSADPSEILVASADQEQSPAVPIQSEAESAASTVEADPSPAATAGAISDPEARTADPAEVQQLMARLTALIGSLKGKNDAIQPEVLEAWKTGLRDLAAMGAAGIPAILQFMTDGTDVLFSRELRTELGQWSARTGMIQALRQIGGPEAIAAMSQILDKPQTYQELALLAQSLEEANPGQYRDQAIAVARAQLATAIAAPANSGSPDIAPLFEVLGAYGNTDSAQDIEAAAGHWKYYAMSALAQLPEGAGVPSLIRLAEPNSPGGNRLQALQVLTELAPSNEAARDFLIAQAGSGGIPADYWSYLKQPLAGNQYFVADAVLTQYPPVSNWADLQTIHINAGNQTLYSIPSSASQTPEGIQRQLALIDQLSGFAQGAAAQRSLKQSRQVLELRMQRAVAGQPAFTTENP